MVAVATARGRPQEQAAELAVQHRTNLTRKGRTISGRRWRAQLTRELYRSIDAFSARSDERRALAATREWLADNEYVISESLRQIEINLPGHFVRELPRVACADGVTPRALDLLRDLVAHSAVPIDLPSLQGFVARYQREVILTLGELWAVPTLLRGVIIETLQRALADRDLDDEDQRTSLVAGCIQTLRTIAAADWNGFVDATSRVEQVLREDPSGFYAQMDFDSRNVYRKRIERCARRFGRSEPETARTVVELAVAAPADGPARERHVGYYLIDAGYRTAIQVLAERPARADRTRRLRGLKFYGYLLLMATFTASLLAAVTLVLEPAAPSATAILLLLALIPAMGLAVTFVQWLVPFLHVPRVLPKLNFSEGIPADYRCVVVVPCLLTDKHEIDELLSAIEKCYLGNTDEHLHFVLLSDYVDADAESLPEDEVLLKQANDGIAALNERYQTAGHRPFGILHRPRLWNPGAGRWLGWERKRGKLQELTDWLRGGDGAGFSHRLGDLTAMRRAKFVITLDADTRLPPGSAARLCGTLAHPLNQPIVIDGRVSAGYAFVQPRADIHPVSANLSTYARLKTGSAGLDLYQQAVSEVYQDLLGRGSFSGKGIYSVEAVDKCLTGRLPENAVLSHDLLEGELTRAAHASDIVVLEDAPSSLQGELRRQHRWVRGDWQLLPWLFGAVAGQAPDAETRLDALGRWKLLDNLRRSLSPPTALLALILGWLLLEAGAGLWTLALLAVPGLPVLLATVSALRLRGWRWGTLRLGMTQVLERLANGLSQWLLDIAFLPLFAGTHLDAIARTLWRLYRSRRRLLEWTAAAASARLEASGSVGNALRQLWLAPGVALTAGGLVYWLAPANLPFAAPVLVLWLLAPPLAALLARHRRADHNEITEDGRKALRQVARRTWRFFERFVGPDTHWLPPDNFQEIPKAVVANRTSPTNIGLLLLATVAAHDLGYIGAEELRFRIDGTLRTLAGLRRFRGHFFNWYELNKLEILAPAYVSTVDSGNLAAAMLVARTALQELTNESLPHARGAAALNDAVAVMESLVARLDRRTGMRFRTGLAAVRAEVASVDATLQLWPPLLRRIMDTHAPELDGAILELSSAGISSLEVDLGELHAWTRRLHGQADALLHDLLAAVPWLTWQSEMPADLHVASTDWLPAAALSTAAERDAAVTQIEALLAAEAARDPAPDIAAWVADRQAELAAWRERRGATAQAHRDLSDRLETFVKEMDFDFLFDKNRKLFHIGYNNDTGELDPSYYDLLASEARVASLIAIAKGDVPPGHWVRLGRPVTRVGGVRVLMSWSATAFEYLLPQVFMRAPRYGLLDASCRAAVARQRRLSRRGQRAWGVSESGYHEFDASDNYRYYAFGVPELALRREQKQRLVVSPYSSALALPYEPQAVIDNFALLEAMGASGPYGFYEAVDYGFESGSVGDPPRIVYSYMAHHQAMILAAVCNALTDDALAERFHSVPQISGVTYLLHERLPRRTPMQSLPKVAPPPRPRHPELTESADLELDDTRRERYVAALGNGHLTARVSGSGGGDLSWNRMSVTRWRPVIDGPGAGDCLYVEDLDAGKLWSSATLAVQPEAAPQVICAPHQLEFRAHVDGLRLRMAMTVAAHSDVAVRRITLTNESTRRRRLRLTHCAEIVLGPADGDLRHPAFSKLFIEARHEAKLNTLLFTRRPRSESETPPAVAFTALAPPHALQGRHFETSRARFFGRLGRRDQPAGFGPDQTGDTLARTELDPLAAVGVTLELEPGTTVQCAFLAAVATRADRARELLDHFGTLERVNWTFDEARRRALAELSRIGLPAVRALDLQRLYGRLLWPRHLTANAALASRGLSSVQSTLWGRGISGDHPIVLMRASRRRHLTLVREVLQWAAYLYRHGIVVDVLLLDTSAMSYQQQTHEKLLALVDDYRAWAGGGHSHAYVLPAQDLSADDLAGLSAAAAANLDAGRGGLADTRREARAAAELPPFIPMPSTPLEHEPTEAVSRPQDLEFDNGIGGFHADGREYLVYLAPGEKTPAPWCNVLANPDFGALVTETGATTTWFGNSSEFRLTPWSNDPVTERSGEALYLRDEETGEIWSPTPGPRPAAAPYIVAHGAGYTRFAHSSHGLRQETTIFVDPEWSVKFQRVKLQNLWRRPRRITLTAFHEWVLGTNLRDHAALLETGIDSKVPALLVRNPYTRFCDARTAFLTASESPHGYTTDRLEFLGTRRDPADPAALHRIGLSNSVIHGGESCAAYQLHIMLEPGETHEVHFCCGAASDREAALELAHRACQPQVAAQREEALRHHWDELLDGCRIATPNRALDIMMNRWLPYQVIAARLWGRCGFYQSSGGFGYRDQLQDSLALLLTKPQLTRKQILIAAEMQFPQGDVLHWWHPQPTRGVRTRCSDDRLWLPYVVSEYLLATGDAALLDAQAAYLHGEVLADDEHERYAEFGHGEESGSVYDHCCRAIDVSLGVGAHGLPLMGGGDWNDGYNRVGAAGRGESVWLAWFLIDVLQRFAAVAKQRADPDRAADYLAHAERLRTAVEASAWDGAWYARGYYDDGSVLGGADADECKIDLNAQTWAALTGAGDRDRVQQAIAAVETHLVDADRRLIKLLTPAFALSTHDPGYIKAYPRGVRENGGQYTHAATWAVWAALECGQPDRAARWTDMLNPVLRVTDRDSASVYAAEPYVLAGDIYSEAPYAGRGGWSWYTGAAAWLYRIVLREMLGLRIENGRLRPQPRVCSDWQEFGVHLRIGRSCYRIVVREPAVLAEAAAMLQLDGKAVEQLRLSDDGHDHEVLIAPFALARNRSPVIST